MARTYQRLTAATVKALATKPGMWPDGDGLYLQVTKGGVASWIYRYARGGRERAMGLGPLRRTPLADARRLARDARAIRDQDLDPLGERRAKRQAQAVAAARSMTFRECAQAYIAAHRAGWKNAIHAGQWGTTLSRYAFPTLADLPVQAVDVGLVDKVLQPIWTKKPETASRVRGRIEAVLDWAKARGYRDGENPARWKGHLDQLLPSRRKVRATRHHPALPYGEIGAFMAELRAREGVAARALEFCILTATRTTEVIGARWDEINVAEKVWVIPASRMKAGREHRVPLSDSAMAIVEQMAKVRTGDHVFPGRGPGAPIGKMSLLLVLRGIGRGDLTVHGFRSSFRDWAAERTSYPREVAELALAHMVGDAVERAYQRGDLFRKRQLLMAAWAKFCTAAPVEGRVVALRASRVPEGA